MISIAELRGGVEDGRVVFDKTGTVISTRPPESLSPATLLVSEMTDALKTVESGRITGSMDRTRVWVVDAIALDAVVLDHLEGEISVEDLIAEVREAGFEWQVSPISDL